MCSGRSKNGCLYAPFLCRLRFRLFPEPSTCMADPGSGGGSESSRDSGGAGIRRVVLQFRHENLTSF